MLAAATVTEPAVRKRNHLLSLAPISARLFSLDAAFISSATL